MFSSGRVVDFILLIIAAEFAFLSWRGRRPNLPAVMLGLFISLAPGACLLLALRAALTGAPWTWVAAWLTLSLPLHIADLIRRRR
jgi:hypothetical protein